MRLKCSADFVFCLNVNHALYFFRHSFLGDHYVEFSKLSQDHVIGTKEHVARVRMFSIMHKNKAFSKRVNVHSHYFSSPDI